MKMPKQRAPYIPLWGAEAVTLAYGSEEQRSRTKASIRRRQAKWDSDYRHRVVRRLRLQARLGELMRSAGEYLREMIREF